MDFARNCRSQLNSDGGNDHSFPFGFHFRGVGYNGATEELA